MEFWGVEVKSGQSLKVLPEEGKLIHISQAAMGEVKDPKGAKNVPLRLKVDGKKFVIGSLAAEDRTQLMFDLVFEREFELSHDWKNGSVYFIGYKADDPASDGEDFSGFEDESEDELLEGRENGEINAKPVPVPLKQAKGAVTKAAPKKEDKRNSGKVDDEDESESDSDEEMGEEESSDVSGDDSEDDDDDDDDDNEVSSEEEQELPKKSKKRPADSAQETPVVTKKAKSATPDKTGNKKGHVATPFPSKTGKTPAGGSKPKDQTPKSGGSASCKSCSKTFNSEKALESHTKAKHGSK